MCGRNDRSYYSSDLSPVTATWGYFVGRGVGLGSSAHRTVLLMLLFSGMGCPAVWKNFISKTQAAVFAETLVPVCQTEPCRILQYRDYNIYLCETLNVVVSGWSIRAPAWNWTKFHFQSQSLGCLNWGAAEQMGRRQLSTNYEPFARISTALPPMACLWMNWPACTHLPNVRWTQ